MDVKDVRTESRVQAVPTPSPESVEAKTDVVSIDTASATNTSTDSISIETSGKETSISLNEARSRLNSAIGAVNVASEATGEIEKIVKSLSGIVDQADDNSTPDNRRVALEKEANQLLDELKRALTTSSPSGLKPLAGDKVRVEVEEKYGKSLDLLLPDHSSDSFGLSLISFSPKESILQTKTKVETARRQIEALREAVDKSKDAVTSVVARVEVAFQNSEASKTTIRDVDAALKLAGETENSIGKDPESALRSFGGVQKNALGLLE